MTWNKISEVNIPEGKGSWLVCLEGKHGKNRYEVFSRREITNGFMETVGGYFAFDFLDKDCYIIAWAEFPKFRE